MSSLRVPERIFSGYLDVFCPEVVNIQNVYLPDYEGPDGFLQTDFRDTNMSRRASYTGGPNLPTGKSNGCAGTQENGGAAPFGPAAPPRKR